MMVGFGDFVPPKVFALFSLAFLRTSQVETGEHSENRSCSWWNFPLPELIFGGVIDPRTLQKKSDR